MPSSGKLRLVTLVRADVSEEVSSSLTKPHGVTSQKTAFFIVISVIISNLT
jgi:hypothetical protein